MQRRPATSHSPIIDKKEMYLRYRIGTSTFSDGTINVPKQVAVNFKLMKGDSLEWYPCGTDFPDEFEKEVIAVLVRRKEKGERR